MKKFIQQLLYARGYFGKRAPAPVCYWLADCLGALVDGLTGLVMLPFGRFGTELRAEVAYRTLQWQCQKRRAEHAAWCERMRHVQREADPRCPTCQQRNSYVREHVQEDGSVIVWHCNVPGCSNNQAGDIT